MKILPSVLILLLGCVPVFSSQNVSLRELAEKLNIYIGFAAVNNFWSLPDAEKYMEIARREFNILTHENQMKWDTIHPERDRYNFTPAEKHVEFAEENGMIVHGHTLVWHNQLPGWLTGREWTREELLNVLEDHIKTVVSHFKGRVKIWDVVNEAVSDSGTYRESVWYKTIGPEYIEKAFRWAKEADPDAILIYNDYSIEEINAKSNFVYNMIKELKEKGVPVDGIGFQMHIDHRGLNYDSFRRNLERFAELGLQIYITEMDVRIPLSGSEEYYLKKQAEVCAKIFEICLKNPAVKAIQFWGFTDKYSWVPGFFKGYGKALLFDENYNPKPCYYAIKEVLEKKRK
ncbi:Endo-1,4-beta-xylanase [Thermotoga petrophila RKU-10]|uniref:Beta-xylanase n=1 Tax=Thermotoga petrophila (strain ATCC BAA-489 / DSM 13996 / JCM 10882 / RKU-10) TaxID=590168 RepID=D2C759_THEP2|nr:endo-1,4-beta-xylanase [Thermotoga petrophila]ADA66795.1 Endo-1,4-beta-xylanase [Thermotoga petrophila RKU-10]